MYFEYSIYTSNQYLFVRFRAGLDTLDVLKNIQTYPNNFEECLVHADTKLTAISLDDLFRPNTSEDGSNKKSDEDKGRICSPEQRKILSRTKMEHCRTSFLDHEEFVP